MTTSNTVKFPDWFSDLASDEFDVNIALSETKVHHLDFDALAWLMRLRADNPNNTRYANMIFGNTIRGGEYLKAEIEPEFVKQADDVRRHFKNKLMITSLRGHTVSSFRQRVTEVVENPNVLHDSDIPVILRLPDFYLEDQVMENLLKNHQSLDKDKTLVDIDERFYYVDRVSRVNRRNPYHRYYFRNSNNNLLCIRVEDESQFLPMINYFINKSDGMGVRGNVTVYRETGYNDFQFYHLGKNYELY